MEKKVIKYRKVKEFKTRLSKQGGYLVIIIPRGYSEGLKHGKEYIIEIYEEIDRQKR